jgi:hypothetical protein
MAQTKDFSIDENATFGFALTYTDSNDVAVNLTGYTARLSIATDYDSTPALTLTQAAGITITPATGRLDIAITPAQTLLLPSKGVYDLVIQSGSGVITRLIEGSIKVNKGVTA